MSVWLTDWRRCRRLSGCAASAWQTGTKRHSMAPAAEAAVSFCGCSFTGSRLSSGGKRRDYTLPYNQAHCSREGVQYLYSWNFAGHLFCGILWVYNNIALRPWNFLYQNRYFMGTVHMPILPVTFVNCAYSWKVFKYYSNMYMNGDRRNTHSQFKIEHCSDVIMARWRLKSPDSRLLTFGSVYSGAYQRKHQSSASLALCAGNLPVTGEFPTQKASNAENVSIWWRHPDKMEIRFWMPHTVPVCEIIEWLLWYLRYTSMTPFYD